VVEQLGHQQKSVPLEVVQLLVVVVVPQVVAVPLKQPGEVVMPFLEVQ